MTSVNLKRSGESIYQGHTIGRAGSAGVQLGEHLAVRFDLEKRERVVGVYAEEQCDPLQIAAVLGFEAAKEFAEESESVGLPIALPPAGRLAARAALLVRLLEVPVLLDARGSWTAQLALVASELVEYGLDPHDLLTDSLHGLPPLLGRPDTETLRRVYADKEIAKAVSLGARALDPMDDEWLWFDTLARDLPQKDLDLMSLLEATPPLEPKTDQLSVVDTRVPVFRGPVFLGGKPQGAAKPADHWELPLYWPQLDEAQRPENDGFDKAVMLTRDRTQFQSNVVVRIEATPSDQERTALFARVVADGEIYSLSALLFDDEGWQGTVSLPGEFDRGIHHLEVISPGKMMEPPLADHAKQECEQWVLLAVGLEDRGLDSGYARSRADQLIPPPNAQ